MKHVTRLTLALFVLFVSVSAFARGGMFKPSDEVMKLKADANALALINHLQLTDEQRSEIKAILDTVRPEIATVKAEFEKWENDVMKARLKQVIADLKQNKAPNPMSEDNVNAFNTLRTSKIDLKMKINEAMKKIVDILTPEQQKKLRSFNSRALVGFKKLSFRSIFDKTNPEGFINSIRNAPQAEYDALIKKLKAKIEKIDKMDNTKKAKFKERKKARMQSLIDMIEMVRNMSEDELNEQMDTIQKDFAEVMAKKGHKNGKFDKHGKYGKNGKKGKFDKHGKHGKFDKHGKNGKFGKRGSKFQKLVPTIFYGDAFYNAL